MVVVVGFKVVRGWEGGFSLDLGVAIQKHNAT